MRLRAGLPVLWRGPTEVQLGTDPRWAVVLADLSPSAVVALRACEPGVDTQLMRSVLAAEAVPPAEVEAILEHLLTAHLLVPGAGTGDA